MRRLLLAIILLTACSAPAQPTLPPPLPATLSPTLPPPAESVIVPPTLPTNVQPTAPAFIPPTIDTPPVTTATTPPSATPQPVCCGFKRIADNLASPVFITHAGDTRLFVLEQRGTIRIIEAGQLRLEPFLDIRAEVGATANEQGLLGLAFHPNYVANGQFFVNYTDNNGDTVIERYSVTTDPNRADAGSAQTVLTVEQPYPNHNGGMLAFGGDGLLYIGMGDGGSAGDPHDHSQNPRSLLGKLLRLNVSVANPSPEIWALGLRNPWRFSFDRLTGDLYIGDVGQGAWEEISFLPAPLVAGANFGWNILEGSQPYAGGNTSGLIPPIAEYSHSEGGCSVTGGYVYRGAAFPSLQGAYLFGDYCSGLIWVLLRSGSGEWVRSVFARTDFNITSFGEDVNGELYLADRNGGIYLLAGKGD